MAKLQLIPFRERPDLMAESVFAALTSATSFLQAEIFVAEIDPNNMGGDEFCAAYDVDPRNGANCVILEARRGEKVWNVGALVPVGHRMDIGGAVRRHVNARKIGVAPLENVLAETGMEYGSITAVGLPTEWTVLVDEKVADRDYVFIGSGKVRSKIRVPGTYFDQSNQFAIFPGLGIRKE
jgi:prolyl-tRNA editing enzyme YbaK/EbsC (Cys-tRNA(Pro) deacylase)